MELLLIVAVLLLSLVLLSQILKKIKGDIMSLLDDSLAELKAEIDALPGRINDKIGSLTNALVELKALTEEYADYRKAEDAEDVEQNAALDALTAQLEEQLSIATQAAADISAEAKRLSGVVAEDEPVEETPVDPEPEPETETPPAVIADANPNPPTDSEIADDTAATE